MALQISTLLTTANADLQAGIASAYASKRTNQYAEAAHRTKYRPNPLNYALQDTYKLFVLFNDGKVCNLIAPVFKTTYAAFKLYHDKPGFTVQYDYHAAFMDFMNRIQVKYYGQYKLASIYEIKGYESKEIIRYENGKEAPAAHPFDGVLHTDIVLTSDRLAEAVKMYGNEKS